VPTVTYLLGVIGKLRGPRPGVCHRCGWRGNVSHVVDRRRSLFTIGHSFGRLCEECATDLFPERQTLTRVGKVQPPDIMPERRRQVA
jgi:hypothetical protein